MLLVVRKAEDILTTYQELARMYRREEQLEKEVDNRDNTITVLQGKLATLAIENETLLREVEHWKTKAQFHKEVAARREVNG